MTKDQLIQFVDAKSSQRRVSYAAIDKNGGALCGWAGFENANINSVDDKFAANLRKAYDRLRERQPRLLREMKVDMKIELVETNRMRVLFYPIAFDFQKYDLGVTYNEDWIDEIQRFGHRREDIKYSSLVNKSEAVAHSWRDCKQVPPLPSKIPKIVVGEEMQEPVEINCELQAIILVNGTLDDFFESDGDKYLWLFVVTSNGIEEWNYHEWKWQRAN